MLSQIRALVRPLGVGRCLLRTRLMAQNIRVDFRLGWPDKILCSYNAFGDTLLLSAVAHALVKNGMKRVSIATPRAELFANNPDIWSILNCTEATYFAMRECIDKLRFVHYSVQTGVPGILQSPSEHIISVMCRKAGVTGMIELLPRFYFLKEEMDRLKPEKETVIVQSSIANAGFPILNKEWYPERMQIVVDKVNMHFNVVQVGLKSDPLLSGVVDMRGKLSVRVRLKIHE